MSRDGSGTYTLPAGNPVVTLTTIATAWANTTLQDIANELTNSIDKAGRTSPTANLPMNGFKHTGAAAASATGQYLLFGQANMGTLDPSVVTAALGAVGAPSYTFNGDLNTGMWSPGADTLAWSTVGAERLRINNSGQCTQNGTAVGISTNANTALTLAMGTGAYISAKGSGGQEMIAGADTSGVVVGSFSNHSVFIRSNNVDRVTLDTSGNLAIGGTPSGASLFEVVKATAIQGIFRSTSSVGYTSVRLYNDQNLNSRALEIDYSGSAFAGSILSGSPTGEAAAISTTGAFPLVLGTNNTSRVIIDSSGNVGLGVAPAKPLHVKSAAVEIVRLETTTARGGGLVYLNFQDPTGAKGYIGYGSANDKFELVNQLNADMNFYTNGTLRFTIAADGRIGGAALHNNATLPSGTSPQYIASGTYTPTITVGTNVTAATPSGTWKWVRVGNVVVVTGLITVTVTSGSTGSNFEATLPIASNLGASGDLAGSGGSGLGDLAMQVQGNSGTDRAVCSFLSAATTGARTMSFMFEYEVL